MSRFANDLLFETIQIRDGIPQRLELHQERMDRSHKHFFGSAPAFALSDLIDVPIEMCSGLAKCRVLYGEKVGRVEFSTYSPRAHNGIAIARIASDFEYGFKYTKREEFDRLESEHPNKAVIISRAGVITDSTYANIVLHDGARWITPKSYLLNGVMRQWLLAEGTIEEEDIREHDLRLFRSLKLINAMLEWDQSPEIPLHSKLFE
ncbi:MAG TPA: aminotransferase class IV [Candidatus Kapabacteria bacterium]|jgi:4-amino-4-deoxychorismate lyase|nr:aminotransferase class IV [Candidatus Kapabacteria bacterium]